MRSHQQGDSIKFFAQKEGLHVPYRFYFLKIPCGDSTGNLLLAVTYTIILCFCVTDSLSHQQSNHKIELNSSYYYRLILAMAEQNDFRQLVKS